jgi:hypothetical protein
MSAHAGQATKKLPPDRRYVVVYNWIVRAFGPKQLAAAVLACYFLAKLLPVTQRVRRRRADGAWAETAVRQAPAAKGKRGDGGRCWEFFSVASLAKQLCWTYQRTERALTALDDAKHKAFVFDWLGMSVSVDPLALLAMKEESSKKEHEHVRDRTMIRLDSFEDSTAAYKPGLESLPELVSLITRKTNCSRLYGMDSKRCGRHLAAALLLGYLRGRIRHHRQRKQLGKNECYTRSDEQISGDTGLGVDRVYEMRKQLVKLKLIQVERVKSRGLTWPINGYTLLRKR